MFVKHAKIRNSVFNGFYLQYHFIYDMNKHADLLLKNDDKNKIILKKEKDSLNKVISYIYQK